MVRRIRGKERMGSFPQNYICTCGGLKTKVIRFETDIESGQHAFGFGTGFLLLFKKTPLVRLCQECQGSLDFVYDLSIHSEGIPLIKNGLVCLRYRNLEGPAECQSGGEYNLTEE